MSDEKSNQEPFLSWEDLVRVMRQMRAQTGAAKEIEYEGYRMGPKRYWYLGSLPASVPWWPEVVKWTHEEGDERVDAPMLFSTLAGAGKQLRALHAAAGDEYLYHVAQHGEEKVNEAYDNTPPTMFHFLEVETLLGHLEDSYFLCVVVDGQLMLRRDFAEKLRRQLSER